MVKKEGKNLMRTCTALMQTDKPSTLPSGPLRVISVNKCRGLVLVELLLVIAILGLMTGIVAVKLLPGFERATFKREAYEIIDALKMAQNAAAQSNRRYGVFFDLLEPQNYSLRQINVLEDLANDAIPDEEMVLATKILSERCEIAYIRFDDGDDTRDEGENLLDLKTHFVAGRSGWQNGGKIVLLDKKGNPYSIVINRIGRMITLMEDDVDIFFLEAKKDVPF
jgi:type II secretory pathway pseudopilin PulG